jgi:glycosyltransferase involved in cell wall biosynthesis
MIEEVLNRAQDFDFIHFHVDYLHFIRSRHEPVPCVTTLHGRLDIPDLVPLYREFRDLPLISISDSQRKPLPWVNWVGTVHHGLPADLLAFSESGGNYLAFLGRVSPEKGLDHAIEIATRAEMPLKIAAKIDRADRDYYEEVIKPLLDHPLVEFVGEIGSAEKAEFLGNAAALLFPIEWSEPFGLVMIEAMACGTPVIAYPFGSVPEVILDGVNGFLVSNVEQALEAVKRLGDFDRSGCRQYFELNFTDEQMTRNYLSIYQKLVHPKSASITVEEGVLNWMEVESHTPSTT